MKKIIMFALASAMAAMGSLPALAQNEFTFTTTSSFYAGNAKLPAGTYMLRQMQGEPNVQILQNKAGTHSVLLDSRQSAKTSNGKPEVVFNKYGTTDYLEGLVTSTGISLDFETTTAEKIAAKTATAQPHTLATK